MSPEPARESILEKRDQATVMVLAAGLVLLGAFWIMVPSGSFSADEMAVENASSPRIVRVEQAVVAPVQYLVDINQADVHDLILLPGVGEKTAGKIIAERELNGAYSSVNDLVRVRGIGAKKVEALRDHVLPISETEQQMASSDSAALKNGTL